MSTLRALNRFGLGARTGERQRISDARGWLKAQLDGGAAVASLRRRRVPGRDRRRRAKASHAGAEETSRSAGKRGGAWSTSLPAKRAPRWKRASPAIGRSSSGWSPSGRITCASRRASKILVAPLAGSYERDVIRPHVLGRFEDMVLASAKHPAMLAYLDNFQSIGPSSPGARAGQRNGGARRGLNENYARELLELHTLGVNGGYTQEDVQELARILTGWTIEGIGAVRSHGTQSRPARRGSGVVRRARPEPGSPIGFTFQEVAARAGDEDGAQGALQGRRPRRRRTRDSRVVPAPVHCAVRRRQARDALHQRRSAGGGRRSPGARVPLERGRSEGRRASARGRTRGVARGRAEVPHAAGLVRRRHARLRRRTR